jgi:aminoglycoside phosphotransferase (APT) family kinase protein
LNLALSFLSENWQKLGLNNAESPQHLSSVLITPRFQASSHVVFILLQKERSEPVLVVKVNRLAGESPSLEREHANLVKIQATRLGGFDSIPRSVAFERYHDHQLLVQTALVGRQMDPGSVRGNLAGCVSPVVDWLVDVHEASLVSSANSPDWFERLVQSPVRFFQQIVALNKEEIHLVQRTQELLSSLRDANLSLGFEHGDLSHPNVMRLQSGGPGVVDWEQADPYGLPICDLFFFLAYVAFALHRSREKDNHLAAIQETFFHPESWARSYIEKYAEHVQLPGSLLAPLFVLCWFRYLVGQLTRLRGAADAQPQIDDETIQWLRKNRYYRIWQHAVAHVGELKWMRS